MTEYHNPVLLHPSVDAVVTNPDGCYVDATFGGGGHSREILSRLSPRGRLMAFDRDAEALAQAPDDSRLILIHNNFRFIHNYILLEAAGESAALSGSCEVRSLETAGTSAASDAEAGSLLSGNAGEPRTPGSSTEGGRRQPGSPSQAAGRPGTEAPAADSPGGTEDCTSRIFSGGADGILADLGVSSHQFDTAGRGFSFRYDSPLDMRMNAQGGRTAADIVNSYTQEELEKVLRLYGEVDNARRISQLITEARSKAPILTTADLDKAIASALPSFAQHKQLARIYQAFRMEVNDEMRSLEKFLDGAARSLKPGGRLVVITYHSIEDRMVKNFIRTGNVGGVEHKDEFGRTEAPLRAVNRKPIVPEEEEIASNTRARSAKLRIAEKLPDAYGHPDIRRAGQGGAKEGGRGR